MVALGHRDADKFLRQPPEGVVAFLFHGSDAGLISERTRRCIQILVPDPDDPFAVARLSAEDLASDPQRLLDEAFTVPLFSTTRCIRVDASSSGQVPGLDLLLKQPPDKAKIVIAAGGLRRDSLLRRLCEQDRRAVAIECNPDGPEESARLVDEALSQAGLKIAAQAKSLLVSLLGADRLAARSELEKLVTYAHGKTEICLADIEAVTTAAPLFGQEMAVAAAFEGRSENLASHWQQVVLTSADAQAVIAGALRYALGLHMRHTRGMETSHWSATDMRRQIKVLSEAVRKTRRDPGLANAIAFRCLWSIAMRAGRRPPGSS